jgi:diguanylate cyclase (GGDEF)-like protein/PAS domain S-box-containing protein
MLDMKTVVFGYVVTSALITVFIALLWCWNRKRYAGTFQWLIGYILQVLGLYLTIPRDILPESITVVLANTIIIAGFLALFIGLELFVGQTRSQFHNYLLLAAFVGGMAYFTYIQPDISIRIVLISVAILFLALQCAVLMLGRIDLRLRPATRSVGVIFLLYVLVSLSRIVFTVYQPLTPNEDWFQSPSTQAVSMLVFQMLSIALTFALILMFTRRLWRDGQELEVERRRAEGALRESESRLAAVFRASPIGISLTHFPEGRLADANDAYLILLGYRREELIGRLIPEMDVWVDLVDRERIIAVMREQSSLRDVETRFRRKTGEIADVSLSVELIEASGEHFMLMLARDITERKQAEETLRRANESIVAVNHDLEKALEREQLLSRVDGLTGVCNRRYFFELAAHELAVAKRYHRPLSLVIFDLDNFKQVNDTFGHQAGDDLLVRAAQIARGLLREADIFARYGGDEFAILLPDSTAQASAIVANRIREKIAADQISTKEGQAGVTISVGIAECPVEACSMDQLVQQADQAMYAAKAAGRNRNAVYSPDM